MPHQLGSLFRNTRLEQRPVSVQPAKCCYKAQCAIRTARGTTLGVPQRPRIRREQRAGNGAALFHVRVDNQTLQTMRSAVTAKPERQHLLTRCDLSPYRRRRPPLDNRRRWQSRVDDLDSSILNEMRRDLGHVETQHTSLRWDQVACDDPTDISSNGKVATPESTATTTTGSDSP